ncbi:MAG: hypothetical protein KBD31_01395 [Proteobacteria bacterium]|nr:hypothetical protein [Pseudomonadota bacterium]
MIGYIFICISVFACLSAATPPSNLNDFLFDDDNVTGSLDVPESASHEDPALFFGGNLSSCFIPCQSANFIDFEEDELDKVLTEKVEKQLQDFDHECDILLCDFDDTLFLYEKKRERSCGLIDLFNRYRQRGNAFIYTAGTTFLSYAEDIGIERKPMPMDTRNKFREYNAVNSQMRIFHEERVPFSCRQDHYQLSLRDNLFYFPEFLTFHTSHAHLSSHDFVAGGKGFAIKGENLHEVVQFLFFLRGGKQIRNIYFIDDLEHFIHPMVRHAERLRELSIISGGIRPIHVPLHK